MRKKSLHNIKSSGFKTPEQYMEKFDDLLLTKLNTNVSLRDNKSSGFNVPDDYFETFDEKLMKGLSNDKEVKVLPLWSSNRLVFVSGIAATILLMISLFNLYSPVPTFGNLETSAIEDYIVQEDISRENIASLVTDNLTMDNFMDSHLIDSNLEEYILNNASVEDYLNE